MTVQSVVKEVCSFVGVRPPNGSIFVSPYQDRTPWEFVQLANEVAQRIAYDTRDWQALTARCVFTGSGVDAFPLPADWQRMLLSANVWKSTNNLTPMSYISDPDVWLRKELLGNTIPIGEWIILGNAMNIRPRLGSPVVGPPASPAETVTFYYLKNTCVKLASGGYGNQFLADGDSFVLPERLLKLGMIWQWKANKGASYAEDMANYEDALSRVAGNDKPSPILVGGRPLASDENIAYWGPTPPANTFVGPGR